MHLPLTQRHEAQFLLELEKAAQETPTGESLWEENSHLAPDLEILSRGFEELSQPRLSSGDGHIFLHT